MCGSKGKARSETEFLRRKNLPGVGFISEHQRFYPKRQLASSVIGFVGLDNQGLAGVEHQYHSRLKGATVRTVIEKDARGRYIRTFDESSKQDSASHDVVLTIDEVIQFTTEYHLKKQIKKYRAKGGMAIVMDPNTGEIYAPIPGIVSRIFVKSGDSVKAGKNLCILEAMKMENEISSPINGTITSIHIDSGDNVKRGNLLMEIST